MRDYTGVQAEMRAAIQNPCEETEVTAFLRLLTSVDAISTIYNYSLALEQVIPPALDTLSAAARTMTNNKKGIAAAAQEMGTRAAVTRRLVEVLGFAQGFDLMRMHRPLVTNDFSYYRRLLPKYAVHATTGPLVKVQHDETYSMSMFTAKTTPMFDAVVAAAKAAAANTGKPLSALPSFGGDGTYSGPGIGGGQTVGTVLAVVANSCIAWLKTEGRRTSLSNNEQALTVVRAAVVASAVYDHVADMHLFMRKSPIRLKELIMLVQQDFATEPTLLMTIKCGTKNFGSAHADIQRLLESV